VTISGLADTLPELKEKIDSLGFRKEEIIESTEINIKYKGYIEREKLAADKLHRLDNIRLPKDFDYNSVQSLSTEARQKLSRIQPATIGEASRIPGVSPNDVSVLLVLMGR
jgi:tRNA uridine 5-carboxymethylaminomethyl modification enzyme